MHSSVTSILLIAFSILHGNYQSSVSGRPIDRTYPRTCFKKGKTLRSPINIRTGDLQDVCLTSLAFTSHHWRKNQTFTIKNNGYYANYDSTKRELLKIGGGPLCARYTLASLHFHWSDNDMSGSEHSIDGKSYGMELHMVYVNIKYKYFKDALGQRDGIAVLGFFLEAEAGKYNPLLDGFTNGLTSIIQEPASTVERGINLSLVREAVQSPFYHYKGSLTTTTGEPAQWILFTKPVTIDPTQINPFRSLKTSSGSPLMNIFPQSDYKTGVFLNKCSKY